jgi:hypothetical protein
MSVALFSKSEIAKLYNTLSLDKNVQKFVTELDFFEKRNKFGSESAENFIGRAVWYGYIANVTAYNVQYRENEQIDFNMESEEKFEIFQDAIQLLGSLLYNVATNDGNIFLMDDWYNVLTSIEKEFVIEQPIEIPNYCY